MQVWIALEEDRLGRKARCGGWPKSCAFANGISEQEQKSRIIGRIQTNRHLLERKISCSRVLTLHRCHKRPDRMNWKRSASKRLRMQYRFRGLRRVKCRRTKA